MNNAAAMLYPFVDNILARTCWRILKMLPADWGDGYRNVWLGVTSENQTYFDQRWKHLQNISAMNKFISYEPALGPLRLPKHGPYPDWLISGGENYRDANFLGKAMSGRSCRDYKKGLRLEIPVKAKL
jgi:protein gp37